MVLIVYQDGGHPFPDSCRLGGRPEPGSRLAAGHPEGLALTPVRTSSHLCGVRGKGGPLGPGAGVSVSLHDAWSRLICAGWLPQDRVFGWSGALV